MTVPREFINLWDVVGITPLKAYSRLEILCRKYRGNDPEISINRNMTYIDRLLKREGFVEFDTTSGADRSHTKIIPTEKALGIYNRASDNNL